MFDISFNIISTAFIVLFSVIAIYLWHRLTYWSRIGIPGKRIVDIKWLFTINHENTFEDVQKYGRIYGSYDFYRDIIVINEPDLIRDILVKDFQYFSDRRHFHLGSTKIGLSLFFMPGNDNWKRIRNIISPSFTSGKLKTMMASMSDISDKFISNLKNITEKSKTVDMRKYIGAFAMDVINSCAYGVNTDSLNNPNHLIVVNAKRILNVDAGIGLFLSIMAPPIAKFFKCEPFDSNSVNFFDAITNKIVKERKKLQQIGENDRNKKSDFIQLMIDKEEKTVKDLDIDVSTNEEFFHNEESDEKIVIKDESNRVLSSDELTAQGILFFIAGYDTTSAAISHCIYYLSKYKECQQKLYEELQTITDFNYETLNKLKYLNAVIKESLRLAPPLVCIDRECLKDYKLGNTGITIPAGTLIEIYPYALHRDPEFFPEPEVFKPERFLEESGQPKHHPYAYIPFGGGPRLCIGMRFALNEMRMCVSKLINKFEFGVDPNFKVTYFTGSVLMSPKHLILNIKARN